MSNQPDPSHSPSDGGEDDAVLIDSDSESEVEFISEGVSRLDTATNTQNTQGISPYWLERRSVIFAGSFELKPGMTVELYKDGDFLHVQDIRQDARDGQVWLRGIRLRRNWKMSNKLRKIKNEVCIIQEQLFAPGNTSNAMKLESLPLSDSLTVPLAMDLIYTNRTEQPSYKQQVEFTFRTAELEQQLLELEEDQDRKSLLNHIYDSGKLTCRWKRTILYRMKPNSRVKELVEESFDMLTPAECTPSPEFSVSSEILRMTNIRDPHPIANNERTASGRRYTFFDACCCSGFATRGALAANFHVVGALDNDPIAARSYRANFPGIRFYEMSIFDFLSARAYGIRIDVLHISFPCQFFSPAHTVSGKNDVENREALTALVNFLEIMRPRIVVIEQTFGLDNIKKHKPDMDAFIQGFTHTNYSVSRRIVNMAEYGLPASRRRLIVLAAAPGETRPRFPEPTHNATPNHTNPTLKKCVTIADVFRNVNPRHPNHLDSLRPYTARDLARGGKETYDENTLLKYTMTTGARIPHPNALPRRPCTTHEMILLQGGSPDHRVVGVVTKCREQVGNASPSSVMALFDGKCFKALEATDGPGASQEIPRPRQRAAPEPSVLHTPEIIDLVREDEDNDEVGDEDPDMAHAIQESLKSDIDRATADSLQSNLETARKESAGDSWDNPMDLSDD